MTSAAHGTAIDHEPSEGAAPRHGMPWTEQDFAAVMQASREGCDQEEIAALIGRSVQGLRSQLRRLLPAEERHLTAALVLPRLRQLGRDGDDDWLAEMARPTRSWWELQRDAEAERAERGAAHPPRGPRGSLRAHRLRRRVPGCGDDARGATRDPALRSAATAAGVRLLLEE